MLGRTPECLIRETEHQLVHVLPPACRRGFPRASDRRPSRRPTVTCSRAGLRGSGSVRGRGVPSVTAPARTADERPPADWWTRRAGRGLSIPVPVTVDELVSVGAGPRALSVTRGPCARRSAFRRRRGHLWSLRSRLTRESGYLAVGEASFKDVLRVCVCFQRCFSQHMWS